MNSEDFFFWWEDRPAWVRKASYAAVAVAVYAVGFLVLVQPAGQARQEASRQVEQLDARLEQRRRQIRTYTPPEVDLAAALRRVRGTLAADSSLRGADFESTLLTRLSRHAEEAGVSSPIFNPAGVDTLLAPAGADTGGLRAVTVEGQFDAETRALADFLGRVRTLSAHAFVDTLSVRSALPRHSVFVRFRLLDAVGAVPADTVPGDTGPSPASSDDGGGRDAR